YEHGNADPAYLETKAARLQKAVNNVL
ncbi:MAG: hypothetical protein RLZZ262_2468, partial [Bacteroidota bacterium]